MEQYAWLAVLTLAQGILIALKIIETRGNKKTNATKKSFNNPYPCQRHDDELKEHGESLARIETSIKGLDRRLGRLEDKYNGVK